MPFYRVTLTKIEPLEKTSANPFSLAIDVLKPVPCRTTERTWEFEAANQREVRRLLAEAQQQRLPNVVGFELTGIERIKRPALTTCDMD